MRKRVLIASSGAVLGALLFTFACATTQVNRAKTVSVDVHAVLAAVDDAEMALCNKQQDGTCNSAVPQWTTDKHKEFSAHLVSALKAGKALNEAVRPGVHIKMLIGAVGLAQIVPVAPDAKADLATVSAELETLTGLITGILPPSNPVSIALATAKDAVLKILPVVLS